jgi:hypothetical protein
MKNRDGSFRFDFSGVYNKIDEKNIEYTLDDGRKVTIVFGEENGKVTVAETENSVELHHGGNIG